jgi:hypothetical protein
MALISIVVTLCARGSGKRHLDNAHEPESSFSVHADVTTAPAGWQPTTDASQPHQPYLPIRQARTLPPPSSAESSPDYGVSGDAGDGESSARSTPPATAAKTWAAYIEETARRPPHSSKDGSLRHLPPPRQTPSSLGDWEPAAPLHPGAGVDLWAPFLQLCSPGPTASLGVGG